MKLANGYLAPKPFEVTPAEKAEAVRLGISDGDYTIARGSGAPHTEVVTFVRQHSDAPNIGDLLYWWGFARALGATATQLEKHGKSQKAAGVPVDFEPCVDAMSW